MKRITLFIILFICIFAIPACDSSNTNKIENATGNINENTTEKDDKKENIQLTNVHTVFDNLNTSIQSLKANGYKNLDLSNAVIHFPNITELYNIRLYQYSDAGFDEIVENIKKMVETYFPNHKYSNDNLYYWGEPLNNNADYQWPKVFEIKDKIINDGIRYGFIYESDAHGRTENDAYLMALPQTLSGTYIKGVGKSITSGDYEHLNPWFPTGEYEFVERHRIGNLPEKSYLLYDREMSLAEAVDYAVDFFDNKYIPALTIPQIKTELEAIEVRRFEDIYGYRLLLKNTYDGIAFDYKLDLGNVSGVSDGKEYMEQINEAFMAVSDDIDFWYMGQCFAKVEKEGSAISDIISLEDAVKLFSEKLTDNVKFNVESVELVYCPLNSENEERETTASAAWKMTAQNPNDGKYYIVYADAVSGELRYYTRTTDNR
ncbi:MAG: hypothetical protein IJM37_00530 [Lachnospiraceae bacterium]|nr:hypothetical protein [Lachnospiraceae bacterium]